MYKFLNVCPFDYKAICGPWKGSVTVNCYNNTSWITVVTQPDRPKSVAMVVTFLC